ncbi:hypothetical protein [Anthocerotibacter panamensis]|uniref:hypothetical protein n=1 Tax=Anthocerotibacter panamensis TaxID=2857077 RepID=UPI001C404A18|nr:hypothetical protein [Anthocerotibacter panamensis]
MSWPLALAGVVLWSLAFYLGFWELSHRAITQMAGWLDRWNASEDLTQALASVFSLLPVLVVGGVMFLALANFLNLSWALTLGFMTAVGTGIYQLGKSDGRREKSRKR